MGGMVRGLLLTDPGASGPRSTDDVDLIVEVASRAEYYTKLHPRLINLGFQEDFGGKVICRWTFDFRGQPLKVDVMPSHGKVFDFSNPWYPHAIRTSQQIDLADEAGPVPIRVLSATAFCATKLASYRSRGEGDMYHHDVEDLVAVVDGRRELLDEFDREEPEVRRFIADGIAKLLKEGLEEVLPGHLEGDPASQARFPYVLCTLKRMARNARVLRLGEQVTSASGGEPGATSGANGGPWTYSILQIERATAKSKSPKASLHVAVVARLTSHSMTAGVAGDGRDVLVEDWLGRRFQPLYKLLHAERSARSMLETYDQVLPNEPFDTVWVYELPSNADRLRLLLPFDRIEMPFERPA